MSATIETVISKRLRRTVNNVSRNVVDGVLFGEQYLIFIFKNEYLIFHFKNKYNSVTVAVIV